jgi:hypothetical protein
LPEDTRARIAQEVNHGFLVVIPEHTIELAGQPRLAWWRINPHSGDVTAVTDEGLNQTGVEYKAIVNKDAIDNTVSSVRLIRIWAGGNGDTLFEGLTQPQFIQLIKDLMSLGAKMSYTGLY